MSGSQQLQVRLFRDSFNTPWGFRLQGGKDLNQLLSVQRVFSNSPAEGELQRGDVIVQIGGKAGADLTHKQAQDCIKFGGGQIQLVINRPFPGSIHRQSAPAPQVIRTQQPKAPTLNKAMPQKAPAPSGFQPKKVTLSKLGGGGPEFGSDYSHHQGFAPQRQQTNIHVGPQSQMLNRVQESLDNIVLSPRTPEAYQQPFFSPPPQQAPPTPGQGYRPSQPLFQPNMSFASPTQNPPYQPTFQVLAQNQAQEEEEEFVPVWERRKAFMVDRPRTVPRPRKPVVQPPKQKPKVSKQYGGQTCEFGIDYGSMKRTPKTSWAPQQSQPARPVSQEIVQCEPTGYTVNDERPAWRETLRASGIRPWDMDLDYVYQKPEVSESAPRPAPAKPQRNPASTGGPAAQPPQSPETPKVVHLQYNSPMGLYSDQNIQETFRGQTQAMAAQSAPQQQAQPQPQSQPQSQPQKPAQAPKPGDRDWNQSAVYRMIHEEKTRTTTTFSAPQQQPQPQQQKQQQQQQQQQQRQQQQQPQYQSAPPQALKPQHIYESVAAQPRYNMAGLDDELGVSDF